MTVPWFGPGLPPLSVAGHNEEVFVAFFLDEHEELPVQYEGCGFFVGQSGQFLPGTAPVIAPEESQTAAIIPTRAVPLRRGQQQRAVVQAGQVGVVEEIPRRIGHARRNDEILGERLNVRIGHWIPPVEWLAKSVNEEAR